MSPENINKFKLIVKLEGVIAYKEIECYLCATCEKRKSSYCYRYGEHNKDRIKLDIKYKEYWGGETMENGTFHLYTCHSHK